ncbi:MAG: hypothetical protein ACLQU4_03555 [Limisphaerales bacterium]
MKQTIQHGHKGTAIPLLVHHLKCTTCCCRISYESNVTIVLRRHELCVQLQNAVWMDMLRFIGLLLLPEQKSPADVAGGQEITGTRDCREIVTKLWISLPLTACRGSAILASINGGKAGKCKLVFRKCSSGRPWFFLGRQVEQFCSLNLGASAIQKVCGELRP